jgi:hypothetical protein
MKQIAWRTAVALIVLLGIAAACTAAADEAVLPEISGPAFILFYTDN